MPRDNRRAFLREVERIAPGLARAFEEVVAEIKSGAQIKMLERAIEIGDVEAVFQILRMDPTMFVPLDDAIEGAFRAGGAYAMSTLPPKLLRLSGMRTKARFRGRTPRAENWIDTRSSNLITGRILPDQRDMIRSVLREAIAEGRNPRQTALDLVGRVVDGKRQGGLIGLTDQQAAYVRKMRRDLSDPATAGRYLDRKLRNKRYDGIVERAVAAGKPVSPADIEKMAVKYTNNLLRLRGETVARTETIAAMNAGREEGLEQFVEQGNLRREQVKIVWDATGDQSTRPDHAEMDGQSIVLGESFVMPDGSTMRFPGDPDGPASQTINCRCYASPQIDYYAGLE